ncbi:MAG: hypothetical protein QE271_09035 [Bacteriovoracaceae bacterium]|nr:hypothetical protein [Bacteriovoracaceae bacterium]
MKKLLFIFLSLMFVSNSFAVSIAVDVDNEIDDNDEIKSGRMFRLRNGESKFVVSDFNFLQAIVAFEVKKAENGPAHLIFKIGGQLVYDLNITNVAKRHFISKSVTFPRINTFGPLEIELQGNIKWVKIKNFCASAIVIDDPQFPGGQPGTNLVLNVRSLIPVIEFITSMDSTTGEEQDNFLLPIKSKARGYLNVIELESPAHPDAIKSLQELSTALDSAKEFLKELEKRGDRAFKLSNNIQKVSLIVKSALGQ